MPELPEVETTVRALRKPLIGSTITDVRTHWPRHIATPTLTELQNQIRGQRITAVSRRGKYLLFSLSAGSVLIIHLRMSGHLAVVNKHLPPHKHDRTIFALADGRELRFRDQRKFGKIYLVQDPASVLNKLGPEPLAPEFTVDVLRSRLRGRHRSLKTLLLDQSFIAGIGNIYADEALFYAGLHPLRSASTLADENIAALHHAIQKVLKLGTQREGASIDLYTKPDGTRGDMQNAVAVFHRTGKPCYHCGTPIERIKLSGRSTHFCPQCQLLENRKGTNA